MGIAELEGTLGYFVNLEDKETEALRNSRVAQTAAMRRVTNEFSRTHLRGWSLGNLVLCSVQFSRSVVSDSRKSGAV